VTVLEVLEQNNARYKTLIVNYETPFGAILIMQLNTKGKGKKEILTVKISV